jgi:hypothetical protein
MGTSFSSDVNAVAQNASTYYQMIVDHIFNAAEFNHFRVAETMKYNLNRLTGSRLITTEEQVQLNRLADQAGAGEDVSQLAHAIQGAQNASPLAVALTGIALASTPENAAANLAGAIGGALIGFSPNTEPILSDDGNASARALTCILAAVGGAATVAGSAMMKARAQGG